MLTDWMLIRRAAAELERELRGARVSDAGLLDDGRFALRFSGRRGRGDVTLAVDLFGSPPLVTLVETEVALGGDPSWTRAVATALRGTRAGAVRSRYGDRVLVIDFGTTSRFGVESGAKLVLELIPRFGNALVLRDGTIVAAAKQFSPAENETRSVGVGGPYRPPPLPESRLDATGFAAATMQAERAAIVRAFGAVRPLVPKLVAESFVAEAELLPWPSPGRRAAWLIERSDNLLSTLEGRADGLGPIHVYRDAETIVAAHVIPLVQFAASRHIEEPLLLPIFAEARATFAGRRSNDAGERRRAVLATRIARRRTAVDDELAQVATRRADAAGRDALRAAGDALHTYGLLVPPGATRFRTPDDPVLDIVLDPELDAKANAARYFARYRKAADAQPHLERRLALLESRRGALDELAFETERADIPTLVELSASLDELEGRPPTKAAAPVRVRKPLRIERPSGARIFVGRSPRENVEVTFRIARPDDLWFHARGIPGSHVVLQPPPGAPPNDADLDAAADLAARHSRGALAPRVQIDFTERKYVRKQRDAGPGLVWYTNARSRVGRPEAAPG